MAQGDWYFCLAHRAVEPYEGCRSETRLGPYGTAVEAAHALEHARGRNEEWDTDPRFNSPDEDDEDDDEEDLAGWGPFRR